MPSVYDNSTYQSPTHCGLAPIRHREFRKTVDSASDPGQRLLNVGCGRHFHREWTNLDLVASSPNVTVHDITNGLPYGDGSFDMVYHSHVLEHLKSDQGRELIRECYRVLKSGGILRVVVPDLERIASLYLTMLQGAWAGDQAAQENYDWMKLELLDQLVRESSGGQMGRYMNNNEIPNADFVLARIGSEYQLCRSSFNETKAVSVAPWRRRLHSAIHRMLEKTAATTVRVLLGKNAKEAFDEGLFRSQGEVHRWMYDRFSLKTLCEDIGFEEFTVCRADESQFPDFVRFELDAIDGAIRKPDSLFIECRKPSSFNY